MCQKCIDFAELMDKTVEYLKKHNVEIESLQTDMSIVLEDRREEIYNDANDISL